MWFKPSGSYGMYAALFKPVLNPLEVRLATDTSKNTTIWWFWLIFNPFLQLYIYKYLYCIFWMMKVITFLESQMCHSGIIWTKEEGLGNNIYVGRSCSMTKKIHFDLKQSLVNRADWAQHKERLWNCGYQEGLHRPKNCDEHIVKTGSCVWCTSTKWGILSIAFVGPGIHPQLRNAFLDYMLCMFAKKNLGLSSQQLLLKCFGGFTARLNNANGVVIIDE